VAYPDGWEIYAVHGVRVPRDVVMRPESITVEEIDGERNAEVRRVMIDRYGQSRYLLEGGAVEVHRDDYGTLYRKDVPGDEPLMMVRVRNSTPEHDGSRKDYFLRVDPRLRPLYDDGTFGEPQEMSARNAVASTFGHRGQEYTPEAET
jgi:hypothetical protein